jgi:hypothetical protein
LMTRQATWKIDHFFMDGAVTPNGYGLIRSASYFYFAFCANSFAKGFFIPYLCV